MNTILYTADFHLTANPRDDYRWAMFPWLRKIIPQRDIGAVVIAGDLTDAKDSHPSVLVNRLTEELLSVAALCPVHVLKGNHDYIDPGQPFFAFLGDLRGVSFYKEPTLATICGKSHVFIPHAREFSESLERAEQLNYRRAYRVVIHQPIIGATIHGVKVRGHQSPFRHSKREVIAGDIHEPQWVGSVIYCGSPHPVRFGEEHDPRVLLDEGGKFLRSLGRASVRKRVLTIRKAEELEGAGLMEGDMVRVNFKLGREEFVEWSQHRAEALEICKKLKVDVYGIRLLTVETQHKDSRVHYPPLEQRTPMDVLHDYAKTHDLDPDTVEMGESLLRDATPKKVVQS